MDTYIIQHHIPRLIYVQLKIIMLMHVLEALQDIISVRSREEVNGNLKEKFLNHGMFTIKSLYSI